MKGALLFLLMVIAAVFCGLVIAYLYLRRVADERQSLRREPRTMPFPEKHPPVDLTPTASADLLPHRGDAATAPDGAAIDGAVREVAATKAEHEDQPAAAETARRQQSQPPGSGLDGEMDDLKRITGVGPKLESVLNANGIDRYEQIAAWQEADIAAFDELLPSFHGRIRRDDWVGQARRLIGQGSGVDPTDS